MDDKSRKYPEPTTDMEDLPPKDVDKDVAASVKGGAEPVNNLKTTKPVEPINGGR